MWCSRACGVPVRGVSLGVIDNALDPENHGGQPEHQRPIPREWSALYAMHSDARSQQIRRSEVDPSDKHGE
jgi:hypothetical protein